jgi:hypothetical protein
MKKTILIGLLLVSILFAVACNNIPTTMQPSEKTIIDTQNAPAAKVSTLPLTNQEIDDLVYMREEEKLAHDVYAYLYDIWGLPVFSNIASSEAAHTASISTLLVRYDIADPTTNLTEGQFQNSVLQSLYDQLTAQGSLSLADALRVGAAIEEIDILDLQDTIANTNQADIQLVYENLLSGSFNHLRAFANTLRQQSGETYQPVYLPEDDYQSILAGTSGNGMGAGRSSTRGQGGPMHN